MSQNLEDVSSWSFIQILNNPSTYHHQLDYKEDDNDVYIHHSTQLSSLVMSTKSLEMCTESLGNETGCYFNESMEERDISHGVQRSKCREFKKRIKRTVNFPPPLTSISGNARVRIRSHREGGHLVLRAVSIHACSSYFKAERANGTLTLSWRSDGTNSKVARIAEVGNGEEANSCRKLTSEIGIPRRCKEKSGSRIKGISSWGQFWVAIS
ncbi:hypothetical protein KY290_027024 [Solanum tuberosum]|uniref:FAF domain-containing protein n=1 Tax=Solanum tuberosum TaxID=4113 RepID=A0ABQ7UDY6_SOLTU|nr:hypothetical protein KY290_027024 [Solanum tuberosum]